MTEAGSVAELPSTVKQTTEPLNHDTTNLTTNLTYGPSTTIDLKKQGTLDAPYMSKSNSSHFTKSVSHIGLSEVGVLDKINFDGHNDIHKNSKKLPDIKEHRLEHNIIKASTQHFTWIYQETFFSLSYLIIILLLSQYTKLTFQNILGIYITAYTLILFCFHC